jgi:DegV family protein with EDD domain
VTTSYSIVIDSPADFPQHLADKHELFIVPARVIIGRTNYADGVGITRDKILHELINSKEDIRSQEAPPGNFLEVFDQAMEISDHILYISISHKLSKSFNSATIAARKYRGRITLIDTLNISHGVTMIAHHALLRREQGMELGPLVNEIRDMANSTKVYVLVEELKYLYKGGRIGRAQQTIGSLLNMKPLLHLVDGELDALMSIRGAKAGYAFMEEKAIEHATEYETFGLAGSYGSDNKKFEQLSHSLKERLNPLTYHYESIGPAVSCNVGPKVEAFFITKLPKDSEDLYQ